MWQSNAERRSWVRVKLANALNQAVVLFILLCTLFPFIFMVANSIKDTTEFYFNFWYPVWPPDWENYTTAWDQIGKYMLNTVIVSSASVLLVLFIASLAAFVFSRFDFLGKNTLFYAMIVTLMIPSALTLVPTYLLVKEMGLLNTRMVLILPLVATAQVFGLLLLRGFMGSLPNELFEAARVDGARLWDLYWLVAVPLSRPVMAVVAIQTFLTSWNQFLWPLITISDDSLKVITNGLLAFSGAFSGRLGPQFAAYTLAGIPLLLLFAGASRVFVRGVTGSAFKM